MDTYSLLREFADSWFLIFMFAFFMGTWVWAFWPGNRARHQDAAEIPMRDEATGCDGSCADCAAKHDFLNTPSSNEAVGQRNTPSSSEAVGQRNKPSSSEAVGQRNKPSSSEAVGHKMEVDHG